MATQFCLAAVNTGCTYHTENNDLQKNYVLDRLKRENERLGQEKEDLQNNYVLDSLKRENERLVKGASFKAGFCLALAAVVILLVVGILCFACYTGSLRREKETLGTVLDTLSGENEILGKEKEDLQKNYGILSGENERLGKEKEDLQKNYGILSGENERLGKEKDDFQKNYESLKKEKEKVEAEKEALQKNYDHLKREKDALGKEKEGLLEQNDSLKRENERLGKEASSKVDFCFAVVVVGISVAVIFCFACHKEKEDLQKQNESLKREKERLGKDCEELQQDRNILKSENERLGKEKEDLLEQNEILKREKERLVKEKQDLQKKNDSLKGKNERLGKEKDDLQKNYETLKQEKESLVKEKDDLQKNYETLKQEKEKAEADFKELRRNTNMCVYAVDRDWKILIEACVNVTLDPNTASPLLTVSEDGSQVRFTGERSAEWPSVLGTEGFTSGRRYWEVEVGEKGYWVLGVSTHPHEKSIPEKPGEGYWLVRLDKWKTCKAVSQSVDQTLNLEKICKVWGVYLDHGGGRLSFYNAETRFHIHTLEGSFPGQVYPIFSPGSHDKGPLIIKAKVKNV